MTITALVHGRVASPPTRHDDGGKATTAVRLLVDTDGGSVLVIATGQAYVGDALAALTAGETVSLTGDATVRAWGGRGSQARAGLSLAVHAVLSLPGAARPTREGAAR